MGDVKSKNLYELLGNDHDQDSDKEPEPPVKTVDKNLPRAGKRDAPTVEKTDGTAPAARGGFERRRGGFDDRERGFRDRTNARNNPNPNTNREQPVENTDGTVRGRDSGPGTQRGGRGRGGQRRGGDRHFNRSGRTEHAKQTEHGWGAETGEGEQADEKAGDVLAQEDKKEEIAEEAVQPNEPIPEPEPEPEDTNMSYSDYLAQQAAKKMEGLGVKEARAANEGSKENKKWKNATALDKAAEEEAYFAGQAKAKRERERSQKKQVLDIDYAFKEPSRDTRGGRGGRGRGEGRGEYRGEGRGEGRGGRGGRGRGDGDYRPRGDRGDRGSGFRGRGRGGADRAESAPVPVSDDSAFPALGGK